MAQKRRTTVEERALLYLQGQNEAYMNNAHVKFYSIPRLNLNKSPWIEKWDVESARDLYRPFPWDCEYPKPLLPPVRLPRSVICGGDPGTDFSMRKKYIAEDVTDMTNLFKRKFVKDLDVSTKDLTFTPGDTGATTTLPKFVADLSELMDMDPDPTFDGKYNYYFNGGALGSVKINGENFLIFPYVGELIAAPLVYREASIWKPNLKRAELQSTPKVFLYLP